MNENETMAAYVAIRRLPSVDEPGGTRVLNRTLAELHFVSRIDVFPPCNDWLQRAFHLYRFEFECYCFDAQSARLA